MATKSLRAEVPAPSPLCAAPARAQLWLGPHTDPLPILTFLPLWADRGDTASEARLPPGLHSWGSGQLMKPTVWVLALCPLVGVRPWASALAPLSHLSKGGCEVGRSFTGRCPTSAGGGDTPVLPRAYAQGASEAEGLSGAGSVPPRQTPSVEGVDGAVTFLSWWPHAEPGRLRLPEPPPPPPPPSARRRIWTAGRRPKKAKCGSARRAAGSGRGGWAGDSPRGRAGGRRRRGSRRAGAGAGRACRRPKPGSGNAELGAGVWVTSSLGLRSPPPEFPA